MICEGYARAFALALAVFRRAKAPDPCSVYWYPTHTCAKHFERAVF